MSLDEKNLYPIGGQGGSGGGSTPSEDPDTLQSHTFVSVIDLLGEGQIGGLVGTNTVEKEKSIYIDGTPMRTNGGTENFKGVSWTERTGTQDQSYIDGYGGIETPTSINVQLKFNVPKVISITNSRVDEVRIILAIGGLMVTESDGDIRGSSVSFSIGMATNSGASSEVAARAIKGKASSRYQVAYTVKLPKVANDGTPITRWDIQVTRTTSDSTEAGTQDDLYFDSYSEVITKKLTYPNSALVATRVNSEHFSSMPKREYLVDGLLIKVPSNYNHVTREYTGIWDGSFKLAPTSNPAWIMFDILTNNRYGLGEYIDAGLVDEARLYQIGRYCDQMVDDGFGNLEPRYTVNCTINSRAEAYDLITDICSAFNGMSYWAGGQVGFTIDAPSDPVMAFTSANIEGEFSYSGTSVKDRHSIAVVTYNDPKDDYKQAVEYVEDPDLIERYGVRKIEIQAFGCTSRAQAHRYGRWILYTEHQQSEVCSFTAGMDASTLMPGSIVQIQDEHRAGKRFGGRLLSCTATSAILDDDIDFTGFETGLKFAVMLSDGSFVEREIATKVTRTTVIGTTDKTHTATEVTWVTPLEKLPVSQAVWVISAPNLELVQARVVGVKQGVDLDKFDISVIPHNPNKYAAIEKNVMLEIPPTSILSSRNQVPPSEVRIKQEVLVHQGLSKTRLVIDWERADKAIRYLVEWKRDEDNWVRLPETANLSAEVEDVYKGTYIARVTAIGMSGARSYPQYSVSADLMGKDANIPTPALFEAHGILFGVEMSWAYPTNSKDSSHVVIEVSDTNNVADAKLLAAIPYPATTHTVTGLMGNLTQYYRIKLVDKSGNESEFTPFVSAKTVEDPEILIEMLSGHVDKIVLSADVVNQIEQATRDSEQSLILATNEAAERAAALAAEQVARANAIATEALNRTNAIEAETLNRTNAINAKAAEITAGIDGQIASVQDGINQEIVDRTDAISSVHGALNTYKSSNDAALSSIVQNLEVVTSKQSSTATAVDNLQSSVSGIDGSLSSVQSELTAFKQTVSDANGATSLKIDNLSAAVADSNNATNSRINNVESSVSTLESSVNDKTTILQSSITNLSGQIATKADASALNNYYTRGEADQATSGQLTSFKAGLAIGGDNLLTNTKTFNKAGTVELAKSTLRPNYASFGTAFVTHPDSMLWRTHTVIQVRSDWCGFFYSCNSDNPADWIADQDMTLSMWVKNISNATVNAYGIVPALGHVASIPSGEWQRIVMPIEKGRALRNPANQGLIEFNFTSTEGAFYYAAPMLQYGNVATAWQPSALDSDFDATQFASATYVQNIESNVTAIDGRVTANTNSLANLNVRVDNTQADLVNNYYTKSAANEATSGQITTMRSQLAYGARNFVRNTGAVFAGWYWMFQQPITTKLQGEVTISFDIEVITNSPGGNGAGVGFNMGDGGTGGYKYEWYPDFTHSGHFSHTLTVDSENFTHFGIFANNEVRITKVMVQLGNVEFPWSPAPEDLSSAVSANATAIQNTYTKTEANTATAGQIATFEASLALGGGILDVGRSKVIKTFEFGSGTITVTERKSNSFKIDVTNNGLVSAYISLATNSEKLPIGTSYVFTGKVRTSRTGAVDLIYSRINQFTSDSYIYGEVGTEWQTFTAKGITNTSEGDPLHSLIGAKMPAAIVGDWVEFKDCRVSVNTDEMTIANANSIQAVVNEVSEIEGNLQVLSQKTEKFSASIANAKLPTIVNEDRVNQWHLTVVVPHKTVVGAPTYEHLDGATFVDERYVYDDALTLSNVDNAALYFRAVVYCDTARTITGTLIGDDAHTVYVEGIKVFESGGYTSNNISFYLPAGLSTIDMIASNGGGPGGFSLTPLLSSQVTWLKAVKSQGKDNADAIRAMSASLTNIDGRVTANANQTTSLKVKLDQRKIYRLYSGGLEAATGGSGFIQGFNPDSMQYIGRSYGLVVFASDGSIQSVNSYDVFGGQVQPFIDAVAAVPIGTWVAVLTSDEPNANRNYLIDSIKSLGGTEVINQLVGRGAYLLVGRKGSPSGTAVELVSNTTQFGCTYMLEMFNGVPTSMGGTSPQAGIVSQMRSEVTTLNGNVQSISETTTRHEASLVTVGRKALSKEHGVDLRGMQSNMYYPVGAFITTETLSYFEVTRTLGSFPENPEWASHGGGFVCQCSWSATGHGWGTSEINRVITDFKNAWTVSGQSALLGPHQLGNSSFEFVWLRGGAQYKFFTSGNINELIVVTSETVYSGQAIAPISYDASLVPQSTLGATAAALDQVRTQVTSVDGKVTSLATRTSTVESTLGGHSASISNVSSSIDGINASHTVKINNNGYSSGFGLISTGSYGETTSAFKVDADFFEVGKSGTGIKPFIIVTSANQIIEGVTYPSAGTYINSAKIANATIKLAHIDTASIGSLSAISANLGTIQVGAANIEDGAITTAKIGEAQITTSKIGDLQVDTLKIKDQAVNVAVAANGVSQLSLETSGGRVAVNIGININYQLSFSNGSNASDSFGIDWIALRALRNGTVIKEYRFSPTAIYDYSVTWRYVNSLPLLVDQPTAGLQTYSIQVSRNSSMSWQTPVEGSAIKLSGISLSLTETKK